MSRRDRKRNPNDELDALKDEYADSIRAGMAEVLWSDAYRTYAANELGGCQICGQDMRLASADDPDEADALGTQAGTEMWVDPNGHAICEVGDDDEITLHDRRELTESELRDSLNDAPAAADSGADDLVKLYVDASGLSMPDFYELAMTVHAGEYQFNDDDAMVGYQVNTSRRSKAFKDSPFNFGRMLAHQALGDGVGWADDHRLKARTGIAELEIPKIDFEIHYDGDDLTWEGGVRGGARVRVHKPNTYMVVRLHRDNSDTHATEVRENEDPRNDSEIRDILQRALDGAGVDEDTPEDEIEYQFVRASDAGAARLAGKSYAWVRYRR